MMLLISVLARLRFGIGGWGRVSHARRVSGVRSGRLAISINVGAP